MTQLSTDILNGKIPPVIRKIRAANYGLNLDEIRQVLKGLWEAGLLEMNGYRIGQDMEMSGDIFTIETTYDEVHIFWNH